MRVSFGNQLLQIQQQVQDRVDGARNEVGGIEVLTNGAFCATRNCTQELATGQVVNLRAYSPTSNGSNPAGLVTHGFVRWIGCDESLGRECVVTMSSDRTVTAEFEQGDAKALEVELQGRPAGLIRSAQLGIDCNNTPATDDDRTIWQGCAAGYRLNEVVELRADAMNATVVRWSENCQVKTNDAWACDVTMDADELVVAEFLDAMVLTTSVLGIGEIRSETLNLGANPDCETTCLYYPTGQVVRLVAQPDPRYRFQQWTGACRGTDPVCEVSLDVSRNVGAIFEIIPVVFQDQFGSNDN